MSITKQVLPAPDITFPLIYGKISSVMEEIDAIGKTRNNTVQNFKFRGIDDVYNELHSVLSKHKVFTVPTIMNRQYRERQTNKGSTMMERILTIRYRFYAEDGSFIDAEVDGEAMDTGDKASNKCMAIAHKYVLLQVFCIPTEDEKDPDTVSPGSKEGFKSFTKVGPPIISATAALGVVLETKKKLGQQIKTLKTELELSDEEMKAEAHRLFQQEDFKLMTVANLEELLAVLQEEKELRSKDSFPPLDTSPQPWMEGTTGPLPGAS